MTTRREQINALCQLARQTQARTMINDEPGDGWTYRELDFPSAQARETFVAEFTKSRLYVSGKVDVGTGVGYYVYIEFELGE